MSNNKEKKYNKGLTLLEALFVCGILAIIIGMAFVLYSRVNGSNKTSEARKEFMEIQSAINSMYGGKSQQIWNTLDEKTIANSGLISQKYIDTNTKQLINPWGGEIVIYNVDQGSLALSYYQIVFYGVPKDGCNILASNHDWMNSGPATQINSYQDNAVTPLNIAFITQNVCVYQYNMFAWATGNAMNANY